MRHIVYKIFACIALLPCCAYGQDTFADPNTGLTFPSTVSIDFNGTPTTLKPTGVATRTKFFVKVYSVAHYMLDPVDGRPKFVVEEIMTEPKPKQFIIRWAIKGPRQKIVKAYRQSFKKILTPLQQEQLSSQVEAWISFFNADENPGDTTAITWFPDGTLTVVKNGQKVGSVQSQEFARAIWSIWFGDKSIVKRGDLMKFVLDKNGSS